MSVQHKQEGKIVRVAGPVVDIAGLTEAQLYEIVRVGEEELIGEIIRINEEGPEHIVTAQVYEETSGVRPGEPAYSTGLPLSAQLGPGILRTIYDGIQRPLSLIKSSTNDDFIRRGIIVAALDHNKKYEFTPRLKVGDEAKGGHVIGEVPETDTVLHHILIPPTVPTIKITEVAEPGNYTIDEIVAKGKDTTGKEYQFKMYHEWPVRIPRPYQRKLPATVPLVTGQRIFDTFFPIAKGGTGAIPGGFGTGKCITGDTPILLANGELIPIEDLYHRAMEHGIGTVVEDNEHETLIELDQPLEIITLDQESQSYTFGKATHLYRGTTDVLVEITTRTGRKVTITPVHKLFRFNGETVEEVEARYLTVGDHLIVPRKIPIDQRITEFNPRDVDPTLRAVDANAIQQAIQLIEKLTQTKSIKQLASELKVSYDVLIGYKLGKNKPTLKFLDELAALAGSDPITVITVKSERQSEPITLPRYMTKELAEWLGLFIADGHIKGGNAVYLYNTSEQILERFQELTHSLFDVDVTIGQDAPNRTPFARINNITLVKFLYYLGIPKNLNKTKNVKIPRCILNAPEEILTHFLCGYFAGDGHFSRFTVQFSTASPYLCSGLTYLLSRLGLLYRSRTKSESHIIEIDGKYAEELAHLFSKYDVYPYQKLQPLLEYASQEIKHFTSIDTIPISQHLLQQLQLHGKDSQGHDIFRKKEGIRLRNYTKQGQTPSTHMLERIASVINDVTNDASSIPSHITSTLQQVLALSKHVHFDPIISIKIIHQPSTPVYDITVTNTHNFVGGHLPFTLHNTVSQHQLAKWSDAKVVVYVGCGERGNEMTEVLEEFPHLKDPYTGKELMERTTLIANTSNMPVAAREASIYTGITLAEYYRDMGYDVSLMADSTSRWAEALREISSRLEEMPGEEGYPAYLASKIAEFYERAGRVLTLNGKEASVTAVGAVSPPGGDFSEPVTQNTLRTVRVFWALSKKLASQRHFPAIDWLLSYSLYDTLDEWFNKNVAPDFVTLRREAMALLQREKELQEIVQLVGPDALPDAEKIVMRTTKLIREAFLQQNAFSEEDSYCSLDKQYRMLKAIITLHHKLLDLHDKGVPAATILRLRLYATIDRFKYFNKEEFTKQYNDVMNTIKALSPETISQYIK